MSPCNIRSATLYLAACYCCLGCQRLPPSNGLLEREATPPLISSHQLRVLVNEYVVYAAHRIELSADKILAENPEPEVRKNALLLKINGIAACFQAASRPDPLGAYLDLWILNRQMLHLSESPAGQELFGRWQPAVTAECDALDLRLQTISQTVSSHLRLGEEFVDKFAVDFPLKGLYFDREPIASRYIEEVQTPSKELFQVVASLDDNLENMRKLTILYAEHLPKQARWEAELLLIDATQLGSLQRPLQDLTIAATAVSRIADTTQTLPQIVESERHAFGALLQEERKQILQEVDGMRAETLAKLGEERAIVLAAIGHERQAAFASLTEERLAVTNDLKDELSRALTATDAITKRRAMELVEQTPQVIDHFFWRAWQLGLAVVVAAGLGWWHFHRRSAKTQPLSNSHGNPGDADDPSQPFRQFKRAA